MRLEANAKERPHTGQIWGLCFLKGCSFTNCIEDFETPHTEHLYLRLLSAFFLSACVFIFREPCVGEALLGLSLVASTSALVVLLSLVSAVLAATALSSSGSGIVSSTSCF